jgi:predicted RecA/RadA family phage recombinase
MIGAGVAAVVVAIAGGGAWWWTHRASKPAIAAQTQNPVPAPTPVAVQPPPVTAPVSPAVPPVAPTDQALTNDNIIQMVEAKVAPAVILSQIRNSKTAFSLSAPEVIRLTKASVPESVIEAMRNPKAAPSRPAAPVASAAPAAAPASTTAASVPPAPAPAPAPAATSPSGSIVAVTLTDGMPFTISLAEDIPQNAEEGSPVHFTAARDLRVGDLVVIAKGAAVTGAIAQAGHKGTFGIGGGKMTLRLLTADTVDGRKCRVRPQSARSSDGKNERPMETNVKPKNKDLVSAAGTEYIAYIDGDVTVSVKK